MGSNRNSSYIQLNPSSSLYLLIFRARLRRPHLRRPHIYLLHVTTQLSLSCQAVSCSQEAPEPPIRYQIGYLQGSRGLDTRSQGSSPATKPITCPGHQHENARGRYNTQRRRAAQMRIGNVHRLVSRLHHGSLLEHITASGWRREGCLGARRFLRKKDLTSMLHIDALERPFQKASFVCAPTLLRTTLLTNFTSRFMPLCSLFPPFFGPSRLLY